MDKGFNHGGMDGGGLYDGALAWMSSSTVARFDLADNVGGGALGGRGWHMSGDGMVEVSLEPRSEKIKKSKRLTL
ncbi:hypothetical protein U1Q18_036483 [Sarracenia purpurea var. burkii]